MSKGGAPMFPLLLRIGLLLVGAGGLTEAGVVTLVISKNPLASNSVMYFGYLLIALQMVISVGLLVGGTYYLVRHRDDHF
jgi:hypothetical protein